MPYDQVAVEPNILYSDGQFSGAILTKMVLCESWDAFVDVFLALTYATFTRQTFAIPDICSRQRVFRACSAGKRQASSKNCNEKSGHGVISHVITAKRVNNRNDRVNHTGMFPYVG